MRATIRIKNERVWAWSISQVKFENRYFSIISGPFPITTSHFANIQSLLSPDQKSKLMSSIDSISKKDHQVNGDYLSLALCTACIDISASTSNATILMGWLSKISC